MPSFHCCYWQCFLCVFVCCHHVDPNGFPYLLMHTRGTNFENFSAQHQRWCMYQSAQKNSGLCQFVIKIEWNQRSPQCCWWKPQLLLSTIITINIINIRLIFHMCNKCIYSINFTAYCWKMVIFTVRAYIFFPSWAMGRSILGIFWPSCNEPLHPWHGWGNLLLWYFSGIDN